MPAPLDVIQFIDTVVCQNNHIINKTIYPKNQYFDNCCWRVIRVNCLFIFLFHNNNKSNCRIPELKHLQKQIEHNLQMQLNWFQQFVHFFSAHIHLDQPKAEFFKIDNVVPTYLFTVFDSLKSKHECTNCKIMYFSPKCNSVTTH